jgi:hypothetical protein
MRKALGQNKILKYHKKDNKNDINVFHSSYGLFCGHFLSVEICIIFTLNRLKRVMFISTKHNLFIKEL